MRAKEYPHEVGQNVADLAAQRDPVLAYAASLLGMAITPEKAGAFFPIEWRK
jgi:hypothetical protein